MKTINKWAALLIVFALVGFGLMPAAQAQNGRAYRYSDTNMRRLIRRIETSTDRFSNLLPNALDRSRLNGTEREDDVNKLVTDFEAATDQLKQRFNRNETTRMDAQMVLQQGTLIDRFMRNHQLDYRTERAWTQVRGELDRLAAAYNVAWNWGVVAQKR
ncbi:MAG: hypothetical protein ICV68_11060 [Pyrinomonadaceae bacterium]|nr:hypothetical protein [Pyrinomonadaceae bacterium]